MSRYLRSFSLKATESALFLRALFLIWGPCRRGSCDSSSTSMASSIAGKLQSCSYSLNLETEGEVAEEGADCSCRRSGDDALVGRIRAVPVNQVGPGPISAHQTIQWWMFISFCLVFGTTNSSRRAFSHELTGLKLFSVMCMKSWLVTISRYGSQWNQAKTKWMSGGLIRIMVEPNLILMVPQKSNLGPDAVGGYCRMRDDQRLSGFLSTTSDSGHPWRSNFFFFFWGCSTLVRNCHGRRTESGNLS